MTSLRQKAAKGIYWSFIDQFSSQGISFLLGVILARILSPSDYGLIAMLEIFTAVANSFINSGFGTALVQKIDRSETDFSTVFFFNMGASLFFYFLLFFSSPLIASFYKSPQLELITKIVALNFVINALTIVPRTILTINVDFKTQTKISIISVIVSGIVGITMAYTGFGVWALVTQGLVAASTQAVLFIYFIRWKPTLIFSNISFKTLFGFGSKLLASGLLDTVYTNIYSLVIGKKFLAADLGFYARAKQLQSLPAQNITNILQRVTFPIFCSIQNEENRMIDAYRRLIRMAAFIVFPLMFLLVLVAKPLILILLTEKWLPAVGLFQILCFAGMWYPIHAINLNILEAMGRSDLFLKLEIWKKAIGVSVLIITIPIGLKALVWGQVFTSCIGLYLNTYYTGKYYNYGIASQLKDIYMFLLISLVLCGTFLFASTFIVSNVLKLFVGAVVYILIYTVISKLFHFEELEVIVSLVRNTFAGIFNKKREVIQ
ncbi:MAG: lipopolysaccharide biosynthesis protein [Bacteroidota bacterium]|nr:lipopolysaccharide biosynthesis protein [Bacteroidota bacterium]